MVHEGPPIVYPAGGPPRPPLPCQTAVQGRLPGFLVFWLNVGAALRSGQRAHCQVWRITMPSSTVTEKVLRPTRSGSRSERPVARSNSQPCHGQRITESAMP